jgi:pimeloyl-ACP methyl ester carboxylesterase
MSCSQTEADAGPAWFVEALADPGELRSVQVRGARVEYRVWGPVGAPVVVLVHGGAAHAGWWDHLAPLLASGRRVAALDLTGHGSSDSREVYEFLTWADEVVAVGEAEGTDRPFVIGHSMGGVAALTTAFKHVDRVAGTVVIDPPDWLVVEGGLPPSRGRDLPPRRFHATRDLAAERFRARPPDAARLDYVERHVAERSVHRTDDGWSWRFDHAVTLHDTFPDELWGGAHGPVVVVLAERSLLTPDQADDLVSRLDGAEMLTIRDAGHHVMLDQPLALTACLEGVLAAWATTRAGSTLNDRTGDRAG